MPLHSTRCGGRVNDGARLNGVANMIKLSSNLSMVAIVAALAVLPGDAHASTETATGTAALNVVDQCTVTGATVNLGTYKATQNWTDVGTALGSYGQGVPYYVVGTQGQEYANYGSVTCTAGWPFSLWIRGSAALRTNAIKITLNGKSATFLPAVKKLGGVTVRDFGTVFSGAGGLGIYGISGVGTGTEQSLIGSAILDFTSPDNTSTLIIYGLGASGTASDTVTYMLSF